MWGDRSGREPVRARSPLRLRRLIALAGSTMCIAGLIVLLLLGWRDWSIVFLVIIAVVGIGDAAVITHRLRR